MSTHQDATAQLCPLLTNPTRLALVAGLRGCVRADFRTIREQLGVTDSTLSKHVSALEGDGIVAVRKGFVGKRARTWLSLTTAGRKTYDAHMAGLRQIADLAFAEAEAEEG
ncbi:transcriptional regulator [Brevibacterium otitidis]|uniref:Transcriptional regulator n=1 Tax=Brevibacterium otitidis TaxID=53364 RepID=A0ABV5X013_9MICO|nr:transcriptional regulator [Brevibacterium otitidis]